MHIYYLISLASLVKPHMVKLLIVKKIAFAEVFTGNCCFSEVQATCPLSHVLDLLQSSVARPWDFPKILGLRYFSWELGNWTIKRIVQSKMYFWYLKEEQNLSILVKVAPNSHWQLKFQHFFPKWTWSKHMWCHGLFWPWIGYSS